MKRRRFLQFSLAAAALAMEARAADPDRPNKGFKVSSGSDRYSEELLIMGGRFDCKVSGKDTNGDLCIYDTIRETKGGPALHRHHYQDEWFYVIRGEFIVKVGEDMFQLHPGDSAFALSKTSPCLCQSQRGRGPAPSPLSSLPGAWRNSSNR